MRKLNKRGFTIIELLIASMVFTTVLLLCMEGITRIAKVYVKNSSIARTNEFAKSFSDEIAQQIKYGSTFNAPVINGDETRLCLGGYAYLIKIKSLPAVQKKPDSTCVNYKTSDFFSSNAQIISPNNMRIMQFSISPTSPSSPYNVSIRAVIGEDDLLEDATGKSPTDTGVNLSTIRCKSGISGSEFCAVIQLNTTATRRMI